MKATKERNSISQTTNLNTSAIMYVADRHSAISNNPMDGWCGLMTQRDAMQTVRGSFESVHPSSVL